MKTMINSKLAIALFAITAFFALSSFLKAPEEKKQYLTLRIFESYASPGTPDAKICVVYEDGKTEEFEMEKFKTSHMTECTKKINEVINSISNKGYDLVNVCVGNGMIYTFVKR